METDDLFCAIDSRIATLLEVAPRRQEWVSEWTRLAPETSDSIRLSTYRQIAASGFLPDAASLFLLAATIGVVERIDEKTSSDGSRRDSLLLASLESHGEMRLAALLKSDREEFYSRFAEGEAFFSGPGKPFDGELPSWLEEFIGEVEKTISFDEDIAPLNIRFSSHPDGGYEVTIFQLSAEFAGGALDGVRITPTLQVDVVRLIDCFGELESAQWCTGDETTAQPHLLMVGKRTGGRIVLQMLAFPPEDEPIAQVYDVEGID